MSVGVGLLITMGIILIFLLGIVSGIIITDQNDEEKQKEGLRYAITFNKFSKEEHEVPCIFYFLKGVKKWEKTLLILE